MIKTSGKIHEQVAALLQEQGISPEGLRVATLSRGTDHLVILGEDTIGEYNHKAKALVLYSDHE